MALFRYPLALVVGLAGTLGLILLLNDLAPVLGVILLAPTVLTGIMLAFDAKGAARVWAAQATRYRRRGDGAAVTPQATQTVARICLALMAVGVAIHFL